jgi:hypothetical protein
MKDIDAAPLNLRFVEPIPALAWVTAELDGGHDLACGSGMAPLAPRRRDVVREGGGHV